MPNEDADDNFTQPIDYNRALADLLRGGWKYYQTNSISRTQRASDGTWTITYSVAAPAVNAGSGTTTPATPNTSSRATTPPTNPAGS